MNPPTLRAADAVEPSALHAAFGAAFADYLIGPFQVPLAGWPLFLARQGVDLAYSRVAEQAGGVLAFALVAPRPDVRRWRLATMGALPAARGSGAAPALLDDFITRARAAGQAAVELEVFAQNERALRLYAGRGFVAEHALHGYRREARAFHDPAPAASAAIAATAATAVEPAAAWAWLHETLLQQPELPLQVTPAALAVMPQPPQAWQHGQAQLVFSVPDSGAIAVHSLVDRHPDQHDAQALLQALMARHPQRDIQVPQLQRLDVGGQALRRLGFVPLPLHQVWMRLLLQADVRDVGSAPITMLNDVGVRP